MKLPNPEKIACKNCKWGRICGILNQSCTKYLQKPDSIYYDNKKCKYFELSQAAIIEKGKKATIDDDNNEEEESD